MRHEIDESVAVVIAYGRGITQRTDTLKQRTRLNQFALRILKKLVGFVGVGVKYLRVFDEIGQPRNHVKLLPSICVDIEPLAGPTHLVHRDQIRSDIGVVSVTGVLQQGVAFESSRNVHVQVSVPIVIVGTR